MEYSEELDKAARKYYEYSCKYEKAKSGNTRALLHKKVEHYRKLTGELFHKEYEYLRKQYE
jgi:hypothetical protein